MDNLFSIAIGALSGVSIAIIIYFLKKKNLKLNKTITSTISVISIFLIITLSNFYIYPHYEAWKFERKIKEISLFSLISRTSPEEYKIFLNKSKKSIISSKDYTELQKHSYELISKVFSKYLSLAPDEQIYRYIHAQISLYEYLYKINPSMIVSLELGIFKNYPELNNSKIQSYVKNVLEKKKEVIKSAINNPTRIPTENEALIYLIPIIKKLIGEYGEANISSFLNGNYDALSDKELAAIIINLYKQIYLSGKKSSGVITRYIGHIEYSTKNKANTEITNQR